MNADQRNRLNSNRLQLRRDVVASQVLPQLLQDKILSGDDAQKVRLAGTDCQQTDALLELLAIRGPRAYTSFRQALVGQYDWLVEVLDKTEAVTSDDELEENALLRKEVSQDMVSVLRSNARLVSRWKALATRLGLRSRVPSIEYKVRVNAEELDQCLEYMVMEWQGIIGSQATVGALLKALELEQFNDVADALRNIACSS